MREHVIYTNKFSTDIDAFERVASNTNLGEDELRLFMALCCRVGSKHCVKLDKKTLRNTLGMGKRDFNKAIENLIENGIIGIWSDNHATDGYIMRYILDYYSE